LDNRIPEPVGFLSSDNLPPSLLSFEFRFCDFVAKEPLERFDGYAKISLISSVFIGRDPGLRTVTEHPEG